MNWWEGLENWQINALKENERPLGLLSAFEQKIMQQVDADDLQIYNLGEWGKTGTLRGRRWPDCVYRVRPDWQRPKRKQEEHWEYCEVFSEDEVWRFCKNGRWNLSSGLSMVGFAGIEYKEFPDKWFSDLGVQVFKHGKDVTPDHGQIVTGSVPATPKRVRFWVEK